MKEFQTVLFLSANNFCRSRYAEAWFNYQACEHSLLWRAESRGLRTCSFSDELSSQALGRLEQFSISRSLTSRRAVKVTLNDLAESSLVIAMSEEELAPLISEEFPKWVNRIQYWNIAEVDLKAPETTLKKIENEVGELVRNLRSGHAFGINCDALVEF